MRKLRRRKAQNNINIMFIISFILIFIFSSGYAAFSTILKLTIEGELVEPETEYVYARNTNYIKEGDLLNQIDDSEKLEITIVPYQTYCGVNDETLDFTNANCYETLEECEDEEAIESPGEKWCEVVPSHEQWCVESSEAGNSCDFGLNFQSDNECNQFISDEGIQAATCEKRTIPTYNSCKDNRTGYDEESACLSDISGEEGATCEKQRIPAIVCNPKTNYREQNNNIYMIRYGIKNDEIVSAEVGFFTGNDENIQYLKGGDATYDTNTTTYNNDSLYYRENKEILLNAFGAENCSITNDGSYGGGIFGYNNHKNNKITPINNIYNNFKLLSNEETFESINCSKDGLQAAADNKGNASSSVYGYYCTIESNGNAYCVEYGSGPE